MKMLMMIKATAESEAGAMPTQEELTKMGSLMEDMANAGVLLGGDGLTPTSKGKRLKISGGKIQEVIDGPFAEIKEVVAGYCLAQFKSWDEAMEWTARFADAVGEGNCELRPLFEADDFGDDFTPELREQENRWQAQGEANARR